MSEIADGLAVFPPNICHVKSPKKEKACGGGEIPGASREKYWALMKKRQSKEKKGFALRRDQNNGEKTGCLPRPSFDAPVPVQGVPGFSRTF